MKPETPHRSWDTTCGTVPGLSRQRGQTQTQTQILIPKPYKSSKTPKTKCPLVLGNIGLSPSTNVSYLG